MNTHRLLPCVLFAGAATFSSFAQIPTKCIEIESILVDAFISFTQCPGSQEGQNEMVRFRVGPDPIALNEISVDWPNNSWQGLVQNATTASLVSAINDGIPGCGQIIEPPGGIIPAGASVLLVTSPEMCLASNSFTSLSDTLHIIFQATGNSAGHFANHNNGLDTVPEPAGPPAFRTLIITYTPTACSDTAIYDRSLLVNQYGNYGGSSAENDGATVLFSWPGIPEATYVNFGDQAPYEPTVLIEQVIGDLCTTGSIELMAFTSDVAAEMYWQGGSGEFSDVNSMNTTYIQGPGESGPVVLEFCVVGSCGLPTCASVEVFAGSIPVVDITADGPTAICAGEAVQLSVNTSDEVIWNTGDESDSITVISPGIYTATITNACGSSSASIEITSGAIPIAGIDGAVSLCSSASIQLTATGSGTYLWSTTEVSSSITVDEPGVYSVIVSNSCGSDTAYHMVEEGSMQAAMDPSIYYGDAPMSVFFMNLSVPDDADFIWHLGDGTISEEFAPTHLYTEPGEYLVLLIGNSNGCIDTTSIIIVVVGPDPIEEPEENVESSVIVPNVFTPNGDGQNDVLELIQESIEQVEMGIYDRWGHMVYEIQFPRQAWDGRTMAGERVPDGTYFYDLRAVGFDGKHHESRGTVTVLR